MDTRRWYFIIFDGSSIGKDSTYNISAETSIYYGENWWGRTRSLTYDQWVCTDESWCCCARGTCIGDICTGYYTEAGIAYGGRCTTEGHEDHMHQEEVVQQEESVKQKDELTRYAGGLFDMYVLTRYLYHVASRL